MAFVPLSINNSLGTIKANIRSQTGTLSPQESGLFELQINDIVHNAALFVRNLLGRFVDAFYSTSATATEASNLIVISTLELDDVNRLTLYDATHGVIPFVSNHLFYQMQTLYTSTQLADTILATVSNILATDNKLQIKTYRGTNKTSPGTLTLVYPRTPNKATADATKVDIPDTYVPLVQDCATLYVLRKFNKPIDGALEARVTTALASYGAQLGLEVSPKTK